MFYLEVFKLFSNAKNGKIKIRLNITRIKLMSKRATAVSLERIAAMGSIYQILSTCDSP